MRVCMYVSIVCLYISGAVFPVVAFVLPVAYVVVVCAKPQLGLYKTLPLPILYGARRTQGGSGGGRTLRISRAIVLR